MEILQDSNVWFTFSFIIFVVVFYKFAIPVVIKTLDARIEEIKKDLEESENLRIEAQEMLAQYQRKQRDALKESEKIIEKAKENAKNYKKNIEADLDAAMKRREQKLENRIERMKQDAIDEIQLYAAKLSMDAAQKIIIEELDSKTSKNLINKSIGNIGQNIH